MYVKTENPKDIKNYPIRLGSHEYIDTAISFSKLLAVLPTIKEGANSRNANNYITIKCAPLYCNDIEYCFNEDIAMALSELLKSIKSDLDKAIKDGVNDGTSILNRLNNGTITMDDFDKARI
jgi:hypothetical protein